MQDRKVEVTITMSSEEGGGDHTHAFRGEWRWPSPFPQRMLEVTIPMSSGEGGGGLYFFDGTWR